MPCQQQTGGIDCGLFAIARIFDYAAGYRNLGAIYYDQSKMRHHFAQCLLNNHITRFPLLNEANVLKCGWYGFSVQLMPCCLLPLSFYNNSKGTIPCVLCKRIFHIDCVGQVPNYICDECMKKVKGSVPINIH
eukprot:293568_1